MKLNMHLLLQKLEQYQTLSSCGDPHALNIGEIQILSKPYRLPRNQVVYIADAALWEEYPYKELVSNLILVDGCRTPSGLNADASWIALGPTADCSTVYDILSETFEYYRTCYERFLNAIIQQKSLTELLYICTEFFGNPVLCFDSSMALSAWTDHVGEHYLDLEKWKVIEDGHILPETLKYLSDRIAAQPSRLTSGMSYFQSLYKPGFDMIVGPLYIKNEARTFGFLCVCSDFAPLCDGQLALCDLLAEKLSTYQMQTKNRSSQAKSAMESFFRNVFDGMNMHDRYAAECLRSVGWHMEDHYYLCIVPVTESEVSGNAFHFGVKDIKRILGNDLYIYYQGYQVFIVNLGQRFEYPDPFAELQAVVQSRKSYAAISPIQEGFSGIRFLFSLAVDTLKIGKVVSPDKRVHLYTDYRTYFPLLLPENQTNALVMCPRPIVQMYRSDEAYGTEYIQTLYTYLANERSLIKSANALFVHRNTLVYRIDKIKEMLPCDLDDPQCRMDLLYACKLLLLFQKKQCALEPPQKNG